jgi:hypothetical protein
VRDALAQKKQGKRKGETMKWNKKNERAEM